MGRNEKFTESPSAADGNPRVISRESRGRVVCWMSCCFFHRMLFLLERLIVKQTIVIRAWLLGRYFPENEGSGTIQRKQEMLFFPTTKFKLSSENYDFRKLESVISLTASPHLKKFSNEISSDINKCRGFFLMFYNEMCQHLEVLHNS